MTVDATLDAGPASQRATSTSEGMTWTQKLSFGSAEMFIALTFVVLNSWAFYFFVNVVGLPPIWAGAAFIVGRLVDAVLDPIVGRWSDREKAVHGRMRLIRWAILPAALSFVALWFVPLVADGLVARFALAVLVFSIYAFFFTLVAIPRHASLPDLVPGYDARTGQVSINMIFIFAAVLIGISITPALVSGFAGTDVLARTGASAWGLTAIVLTAVGLVFFVPFLVFVPNRKGGPRDAPEPFWSEVRSLFSAPGYGRIVTIFLLTQLATIMVQAMTPFYLESFVGLSGPEQTPFLFVVFLLSILSFPVWAYIARPLGKPGTLILGVCVYLVFLAALPFLPQGLTPGMWTAAVFAGLGVSALNLFPWAMLPDAVDIDAERQGRAREGLVYAVFVFGQKIAGSGAVFANAIVLSVLDYQPGQAEQTPETLRGIVLGTSPLPAFLLVLTIVLCLRFPITREIQARARAGRETAS